jgi:hypothetical protein
MFKMIGTTGSTFNGVFQTSAGAVGFRPIGGDQFRVRVEPRNGAVLALDGWTQPNGQKRYSTVVNGTDALVSAVAQGIAAVAAQSPVKTTKEIVITQEVAPYFA